MTDGNTHIALLDEFAVADMLGVPVATVRKWRYLKHGGPIYYKIGTLCRYKAEDIKEFVDSKLVQGETR